MSPESEDDVDLAELGFEFDEPGECWIDQLREAERSPGLGRIGPFELLDEVNRGGQGVVYRARQPGTKRLIALKRPIAGSFTSDAIRRRFEREIESAAALNHPNIVTAYGMEIVGGTPLLAMEWIEGVDLRRWSAGSFDRGSRGQGSSGHVRSGSGRDPRESIEVFLRICDALAHAHARGILHRDLKPSNILVGADGQPRVLDFGLAKRLSLAEPLAPTGDGAPDPGQELTRSGEFLGTPAYAAPEQFRPGAVPIDERTDIYSLGVILYEMLAGHSPYPHPANVTELIRAIETETPARLSSIDPRLGRELDTIVRKAMAKRPEARYGSVDTLASDLRRYLAGEPISAVEPSTWYLMKKVIGRNRLAFAFAATVLLLVIGFGLNAIQLSRRLRAERDEAMAVKNEFWNQKERVAARARHLERLLLLVTEPDALRLVSPGAEGDRVSPLAPDGTPTAGAARAGSPSCADELLGTRNPHFDPEEFARRRRDLSPGEPGESSGGGAPGELSALRP